MAKIDRPVIVAGNDTTLYIQLKQFDSGEYIDFDLNQVSDLKVELLCAKDNYKYDIPYTIDSEQTNLIICDLKHNYYHSNTSYGIIVSGTNPDGKHWTWTMMPREGFLVVSNTSGLDLREDAQQLSFNGLVGWGITTEADMTNYYTKNQTNNLLNSKQDLLVSGTNIKSINNESILGSGNIDIQIPEQVQSDWNETDTSAPSYIENKPTLFSGDYNDLTNKPDLSNYVTDNELQTELENYVTDSDLADYVDDTELEQHLATKQDTLISGTNIKTINNQSLLGEGNIDIQGGGEDFPEEEFNNIHKVVAEALFDHNSKISNLQSKVNNQTDVIEDLKSDIPELIDTNISDIEKDINSSNRTIAEVVTNLNNRVEVLEDGEDEQVQANWNETDSSDPSYIQNKPTIPTTTSELTNDSGFLTSAVTSFNGATGAITYTAPVTSVNGQTGAVVIETGEHDYSKDYLTFEVIESGTFTFTNRGSGSDLQYSLDNGNTWTSLPSDTETPTIPVGEKIMWKGSRRPSSTGIGTFKSTAKFNIYGNILSLTKGDKFINTSYIEDYVFYSLFYPIRGTLYPVSAEKLILPTTISAACYYKMFYGCKTLTVAPELPALQLANSCYYDMFNGCTNLLKAPVLPATTLQNYCYYQMFRGCTKLNYVKCRALNRDATNCLTNWLNNVAPKGLFIPFATTTTWPSGVSGIPTGWLKGTEEDYNYVHNFELATVATSGSYNDLTNKPNLSNYVSSTTSGLSIEVVSALPATPQDNVIYIVTSQNS